MADRKLEQLKRVPLFEQCSRKELETLARNTDEVSVNAGRTLIVDGEPNHTFYVLLQGEVDAVVKDRPARRLGPGDCFGEISMIDRGVATATVTTASPIEALVMSHMQFRDAIQSNHEIALKVLAVMAERLRRDNKAGL